ncbi:hypothetical protein [Streptomyces niveus]|uniref:hypothetical protein n=1 Tax=Streptomyces niveus TaxID=193462 RepID=UPI0035D96B54
MSEFREALDSIDMPFSGGDVREYWLRKAALLDRVALRCERAGVHGEASADAEAAALYLVDTDRARTPATDADPRGYVRREYACWIKRH